MIGGVFIKMLEDPATWKKWAGRDRTKLDDYAPAPIPPRITEVVPTRRSGRSMAIHVPEASGDWTRPGFDDRHVEARPRAASAPAARPAST